MTAPTKNDVVDICDEEAPAQAGVRPISLSELWDKVQNGPDFVFVMAMDDRRFESAHIEGSISFDRLTEILSDLDRNSEIVVYCTNAACAASKLRAAMLVEAGFTNVYRFAGGLAEWAEAGLPLVESNRRAA